MKRGRDREIGRWGEIEVRSQKSEVRSQKSVGKREFEISPHLPCPPCLPISLSPYLSVPSLGERSLGD
jgi:hypothetical protein